MMKRSLTIGCVLLVGGSVSNCGGNAVGSTLEPDPSSKAGSANAGSGGVVGDVPGNPGVAGGCLGIMCAGGSGPQNPELGPAGDGGWAGSDEPPAVGSGQPDGAGGFVGIPPK